MKLRQSIPPANADKVCTMGIKQRDEIMSRVARYGKRQQRSSSVVYENHRGPVNETLTNDYKSETDGATRTTGSEVKQSPCCIEL